MARPLPIMVEPAMEAEIPTLSLPIEGIFIFFLGTLQAAKRDIPLKKISTWQLYSRLTSAVELPWSINIGDLLNASWPLADQTRCDTWLSQHIFESAAPALNTSQHHTNLSALHNIYYTGDLQPWPGFVDAVRTFHESRTWRQQTLGFMIEARDLYAYGNVEVGDEHGVQGRFQKFFGDVLNTIFESQSTTEENIDLRFADFKCVQSAYPGTPHVILKDSKHALKIVGELKVPWVSEHQIEPRISYAKRLRELLAQPIMYMKDLGCMYGFLSTYEETIFLRQVVDNNGLWRIEYSPVILSFTTYDKRMTTSPVVSVKQCFFYVGLNALNQGPVQNT
ncbi:unnamed protein product [Penicillium salamii]|nr:unnamed protein product [Penicillium salamii]CAG8271780.1 unnamed protein product [Penicillium salamii]CAG8428297.1 unnamed protein product [Penicillium salamii]